MTFPKLEPEKSGPPGRRTLCSAREEDRGRELDGASLRKKDMSRNSGMTTTYEAISSVSNWVVGSLGESGGVTWWVPTGRG